MQMGQILGSNSSELLHKLNCKFKVKSVDNLKRDDMQIALIRILNIIEMKIKPKAVSFLTTKNCLISCAKSKRTLV